MISTFVKLFEDLDSTTSTNEKVELLRQFFTQSSQRDLGWAIFLFSGKYSKRTITSGVLQKIFIGKTSMPEWLFAASYQQVGDTAETISLLINKSVSYLANDALGTSKLNHTPTNDCDGPLTRSTLSLSTSKKTVGFDSETQSLNDSTTDLDLTLNEFFVEFLPTLKTLEPEHLSELIWRYWRALTKEQVFIFNKLMTGAFRVGVSKSLVVKALGLMLDRNESVVQQVLINYPDPRQNFLEFASQVGSDQNLFPFYLASSLDHTFVFEKNRWLAEWKWDGIRAQATSGPNPQVWSRGEELIQESCPEIVAVLKALPEGLTLDGELVGFKSNKILSFHELQTRLNRKKVTSAVALNVPLQFIVFDLLSANFEDLRATPLLERKKMLHTIIAESPFLISPFQILDSEEKMHHLRTSAPKMQAEGLVIKDLHGIYKVGRKKGEWWKFKVNPFTLDAVLLYAQAGSGKRANLFTDYTFALKKDEQLLPFAKAYSGLNNEEINKLDNWIRRNTIEKFGPVRSLKPHHVFEISFEGIDLSKRHKSGIAVRFPRITRWRTDKTIEQISTFEEAIELIEAGKALSLENFEMIEPSMRLANKASLSFTLDTRKKKQKEDAKISLESIKSKTHFAKNTFETNSVRLDETENLRNRFTSPLKNLENKSLNETLVNYKSLPKESLSEKKTENIKLMSHSVEQIQLNFFDHSLSKQPFVKRIQELKKVSVVPLLSPPDRNYKNTEPSKNIRRTTEPNENEVSNSGTALDHLETAPDFSESEPVKFEVDPDLSETTPVIYNAAPDLSETTPVIYNAALDLSKAEPLISKAPGIPERESSNSEACIDDFGKKLR